MSGRKTITLDERDYYRMREEARQARIAREKAEAEARARKQAEKDLRIAKVYNKDLEDRMGNLDKKLTKAQEDASATKRQLIETVKATNKSLSDQAKKFADAMESNNRRIEETISANNEGLRKEIQTVKAETDKEIKKIKATLAALEAKMDGDKEVIKLAQEYFDVAKELMAELGDMRPELFFPGKFEEVKKEMNNAQQDLSYAEGNASASSNALTSSKRAFMAAHKLYEDVVNAEAEWTRKLAVALEALTNAQAEIDERRVFKYFGSEYDTDTWSDGALNELRDAISKIREKLSDEEKVTDVSLSDLDGVASLAKEIGVDAEKILEGAFLAVQISDKRAKTASVIAKELADKAGITTVAKHGYESKDWRAANLIHLKNGLTGFEVVITLKTVFKDGKIGCEADTEILNRGNNAAAAECFDDVLKEVMGKHGFSGDGEIPVNLSKKDDIADWTDRKKATTVSAVKADSSVLQKAQNVAK